MFDERTLRWIAGAGILVSCATATTPADAQGRRRRPAPQTERAEPPNDRATPPAHAETPGPRDAASVDDGTSEDARERARAAYDRGQALFREERYPDAASAFEEAYALLPSPTVLLSIAESHRRAGNVPVAVRALRDYLADRTEAPDAQSLREKLAELEATPSALTLEVVPADAHVTIDGEEVAASPTLELPAGAHVLRVTRDGYAAREQTLSLDPGGRTELRVALEPVPPPRPPARPRVASPSERDAGGGSSAAIWVATGIAGAGLATGTVLGFLALSEQSDFDAAPSARVANRGERLALFADVAFGVSIAAAATAIVLYATADDDDPAESGAPRDVAVRVSPSFGPGLAAGSLEVSF